MSLGKDLSPAFGHVPNWLPLLPLHLIRPSVQTSQITLNERFGLLPPVDEAQRLGRRQQDRVMQQLARTAIPKDRQEHVLAAFTLSVVARCDQSTTSEVDRAVERACQNERVA